MVEVMNICVVIPVYNCHQYLSDAVNSVLNHPYQGIQIVLVVKKSKTSLFYISKMVEFL